MESSTESAITSRDARDAFMPWCPMAMPSVTVIVQNSRGVPLAWADTLLDDLRLTHQGDVAGRRFIPAGGNADERLMNLLSAQSHGVQKRAVRSPFGTLRHMPARQTRFIESPDVHQWPSPPQINLVSIVAPFAAHLLFFRLPASSSAEYILHHRKAASGAFRTHIARLIETDNWLSLWRKRGVLLRLGNSLAKKQQGGAQDGNSGVRMPRSGKESAKHKKIGFQSTPICLVSPAFAGYTQSMHRRHPRLLRGMF